MRLEVKNLSCSYGEHVVAKDICLNVERGEFVGLIGPNGSGKSTILKSLYRAVKPRGGSVYFDGSDLFQMSHRETARTMGVVGQENYVPFDFKVEEIVAMGRNPHKKLFEGDTEEDRSMVRHALAHLGMEDMARRNYSELSGGEKQRVLLARVIAQQTDFLILDEPTNHLDIRYQLQIFDLVKRLQVTVLSAIHDLNIAALYCDRLYGLQEGGVCFAGTPEEVLTPANIYAMYGVHADVTVHPYTGKPAITFIPGEMGGMTGMTGPTTDAAAQEKAHEREGSCTVQCGLAAAELL